MDKRIVKSEQALKSAFIRLLENEEPDKISVIHLCEEANMNRSTFYERYGYMDALIYAVLKDCVEEICSLSEPISEPARQFILIEHGLDKRLIRRYLNNFIKNWIINRFCSCERSAGYCQQIIEIHVDITMNRVHNPHLFYPAYFQNTGVISMVLRWMKDEKPIPLEEMTEIVYQFSKAMYLDYQKGRNYE